MGKELQLLAHPSLLQGEGVPTEAPPDLSQGEGAPSKCLKHCEMGLPPLGEGWGGASVEGDSGAIALAMLLEDYLPMTNSRVPPAMMSA